MSTPTLAVRAGESNLVVLLLIALCAISGLLNPAFLSWATVYDSLQNLTIVGMLGMAVLLVMLSGGVDVSFPAVAALTSYVCVKLCISMEVDIGVVPLYTLAALFGMGLGLFNGFFVAFLGLPALIVTLGTSSLFYGFNLFFVGSQNLFNIPASVDAFARTRWLTFYDATGQAWGVHPATLLFLVIALLTAAALRYTTWGRGIYAIGGNAEAAQRIGLPVKKLEMLLFAAAGGLAGIAGITQVVFSRSANPGALNGSELDVIAAVVLGGVSVTGGKGTVGGALLGLTFVVVMTSSLVLLGVPASWQKLFVGATLILGISLTALRIKRRQSSAPIPYSSMEA